MGQLEHLQTEMVLFLGNKILMSCRISIVSQIPLGMERRGKPDSMVCTTSLLRVQTHYRLRLACTAARKSIYRRPPRFYSAVIMIPNEPHPPTVIHREFSALQPCLFELRD